MQVGAGVAQFADQADVALNNAGLGLVGPAAQAEFEGGRPGIHAGDLVADVGDARVFSVLDNGEADAGGGWPAPRA